MNIDERIGALTHSVQLLAQMHIDNEKAQAERSKKLDSQLSRMITAISKLADIANNHEDCTGDLENGK